MAQKANRRKLIFTQPDKAVLIVLGQSFASRTTIWTVFVTRAVIETLTLFSVAFRQTVNYVIVINKIIMLFSRIADHHRSLKIFFLPSDSHVFTQVTQDSSQLFSHFSASFIDGQVFVSPRQDGKTRW